MNSINCPLCGSLDTNFIESIYASEIESQYFRSFEVNTSLNSEEIKYLSCNGCRLAFFYPMIAGDEKLYEQLQKYDWYYMNDKPEFNLANKYLPITGSILEVGAGKGAFSDLVGKDRYVGLEFNDNAIGRAKAEGVTLLKETIEEHAVNNRQKYKAVVSFQVLEHVSNPSSFIQGCVDSLQEGGSLIFAVPNHGGICGLTQNHLLDMPPHHVTHWFDETLSKLAALFDLELVAMEIETVADYHLDWARKSVWEHRLRRYTGMKSSLLDTSLLARIVSRLALILARVIPVSVDDLKGHAIVAVYRKIR